MSILRGALQISSGFFHLFQASQGFSANQNEANFGRLRELGENDNRTSPLPAIDKLKRSFDSREGF